MKPLKVGLTGPIGAGKSVVAACWQKCGAGLVEGDAMGRLALEIDAALRNALINRFGNRICSKDGSINRAELARTAFADQESQKELTRLTFPTLYRLAREEMDRIGILHRITVFDAALIFEWEIETDFDRIVVVVAEESRLIENSSRRLGIPPMEAEARLSRQIAQKHKSDRADLTIVNDGTLKELEEKARKAWQLLTEWADIRSNTPGT